MLKDVAAEIYLNHNYNCAETLVRAANEYYQLGLDEKGLKVAAVYGGGMQTGSTCGALLGALVTLSEKYVDVRAHESSDITPVAALLQQKWQEKFGTQLCREIKPVYFRPGMRCGGTVAAACDILEQTLAEYDAKKA